MASRTAYIKFMKMSRFFVSAIIRDGEDQNPASMPDFSSELLT